MLFLALRSIGVAGVALRAIAERSLAQGSGRCGDLHSAIRLAHSLSTGFSDAPWTCTIASPSSSLTMGSENSSHRGADPMAFKTEAYILVHSSLFMHSKSRCTRLRFGCILFKTRTTSSEAAQRRGRTAKEHSLLSFQWSEWDERHGR